MTAQNKDLRYPQCTAKSKRSGERCRGAAVKGSDKCRMHGGKNPGAPIGNGNAKTHGLWAKRLATDEGRAVFEEAHAAEPKDLAKREAAHLAAQIHEAFTAPAKLGKAAEKAREILLAMVDEGELTFDQVQAVLAKLAAPTPTQLAKALGPLKGLLDTAAQVEEKAAGTLRDLLTSAHAAPAPTNDDDWED